MINSTTKVMKFLRFSCSEEYKSRPRRLFLLKIKYTRFRHRLCRYWIVGNAFFANLLCHVPSIGVFRRLVTYVCSRSSIDITSTQDNSSECFGSSKIYFRSEEKTNDELFSRIGNIAENEALLIYIYCYVLCIAFILLLFTAFV